MKLVMSLLTITVYLSISNAADYSQSFEQATEFPAYFSPSDDAERLKIKKEIEQILKLRFERMVIPIPDERKPGNYIRVNFMDWAMEEAKKLGLAGRAKFYPSGGLIRNNISGIYELVHRAREQNPTRSVLDVLEEIRRTTPTEVFHTDIRGVSSDLDFLIGGLTKEELGKLNNVLKEKTTKFEKRSGLDQFNDKKGIAKIKKTFLIIPDFKGLEFQILSSTGQGGLEGDFLYFDVTEGRLRDPFDLGDDVVKNNTYLENYKGAVDRVMSGSLRYHPPYNPEAGPAKDSQTVRALRTLTESPWSTVDDFKGAFEEEVDKLDGQTSLSTKASEQLDKMTRNSRFGGGANRFMRPATGKTEQFVKRIQKKFPKEFRTFLALTAPEELKHRSQKLPEELKKAIIPNEKLPSKIFHGTPAVENLPAIIRNGLIMSREDVADKTTAVKGNGAYSSDNYKTAQVYAKSEGVVIPMEFKADALVLDLEKLDKETLLGLEKQAKDRGVHLHSYLHDEFGITAIKSGHFMILDMAAINQPINNYTDILKVYAENYSKLDSAKRTFAEGLNILKLTRYAELSGETEVWKTFVEYFGNDIKKFERGFIDSFARDSIEDIKSLGGIEDFNISESNLKRLVSKFKTPQFQLQLERFLWKRSIKQLVLPNLNGLPLRSDSVLSAKLWDQIEMHLTSGNRLAALAKKDVVAFIRWSNNTELSKPLVANVLKKVNYSGANFDTIKSYLFSEGSLSAVGEWVLNNDPKKFVNYINERNPFGMEGLKNINENQVLRLLDLGLDPEKVLIILGPEKTKKLGIVLTVSNSNRRLFNSGKEFVVWRWFAGEKQINSKLNKGIPLSVEEKQKIKEMIRHGYFQNKQQFSFLKEKLAPVVQEFINDPDPAVRAFARQKGLSTLFNFKNDLRTLRVSDFSVQKLSNKIRNGKYPIDDILSVIAEKDVEIRSKLIETLDKHPEFRDTMRSTVEKYGATEHVRAFPWDPENREDQKAMARMLDSKGNELKRLDRRVRQLAEVGFYKKEGRKPTSAELETEFKRLKEDFKISQIYERAEIRSQRQLPRLSPATEQRLRSLNIQSSEPIKGERRVLGLEFCPQ